MSILSSGAAGAAAGSAAGPWGTALGFLFGAGTDLLGRRRANSAARRTYDSQYTNNPRWNLRNAVLRSFWNEHNLGDRFASMYPDASAPENAGKSVKTPENVLRMATDPPPFEGHGFGGDLLDSALANAPMLANLLHPKAGDDDGEGGGAGGGGFQIPGLDSLTERQGEDFLGGSLSAGGAAAGAGPGNPVAASAPTRMEDGDGASPINVPTPPTANGGQGEDFWRTLFAGHPALLQGLVG